MSNKGVMVSLTKRPQTKQKQDTMANCCDVEMKISGKKEGLLKIADIFNQLENKLKEMREKRENVYYDMVVMGDIMGCPSNIYRRGCFYNTDPQRIRKEIEENENDGYSFFDMSYEGAWAEQGEFHAYLEQTFKEYEVKCHFRATESGCCYFAKNSEEFYPEEYAIDMVTEGVCGIELLYDIIEAADYLGDVLGEITHKPMREYVEMTDAEKNDYKCRLEKIIDGKIEEFNQKSEENGSDDYISMHKYEYVG